MITDKQLDETLVELLRTKRALEALRNIRKANKNPRLLSHTTQVWGGQPADVKSFEYLSPVAAHAAAKRSSLDLTRALAKLRKGDV